MCPPAGGLKTAKSFQSAWPISGAPGAKIALFSTKIGSVTLIKNRGRPSRDFVFPRLWPESGSVFLVRMASAGGTGGQNRSVFDEK